MDDDKSEEIVKLKEMLEHAKEHVIILSEANIKLKENLDKQVICSCKERK
jgi:hypothetical protein